MNKTYAVERASSKLFSLARHTKHHVGVNVTGGGMTIMNAPQVSVIIPTRNRGGFLPKAINSVLDQTFGGFEILIVDDGSQEPVAPIINELQDKRIRLIRHPRRRGGAAARNTAILQSHSEFIAFLDDDDEWYREKLARQIAVLSQSDATVCGVYTGYDVVNRETGTVRGQMLPHATGDLFERLLHGNCIGTTSSVLLKRKCVEAVGMFDESLPAFQDYDLWLRLSRNYQFALISEPLLKYHLHSDKIWTNPDALQEGLEMLLKKYGRFTGFRQKCSTYYLSISRQFRGTGETAKALKALCRAIMLKPLNWKSYFYLAHALIYIGHIRLEKGRILIKAERKEVSNRGVV